VGRTWRERAGITVAAAWTLAGLVAAPAFGVPTTMPAAVAGAGASGALVAGPYAGRLLAAIAGVAGVGSLAATAGILLTGQTYAPGDRAATGWAVAETAGLLVLTLLVVRVAPGRLAVVAAGLSGIAVPAWLLRFASGPVAVAALGAYAAWALLALLAVAVGFYLRSLDRRRSRSVSEARRAQRLQLARDLHDFVAHDISGMLAQAQAGQILAEHDPAATAAAFRRIEQTGRQALASMDRTVRMLHDSSRCIPSRV
jgi:signal transduction histidine kinase